MIDQGTLQIWQLLHDCSLKGAQQLQFEDCWPTNHLFPLTRRISLYDQMDSAKILLRMFQQQNSPSFLLANNLDLDIFPQIVPAKGQESI